jgi:hypothetical protein
LVEFYDQLDKCRNTEATIGALMKIGDDLAQNDPAHNQLDLGAEEYVVNIIGSLVANEHYSYRTDIPLFAIKDANSPYIMVKLMKKFKQGVRFGVEADDDEEREKLFKERDMEKLESVVQERIQEAADSGTLHKSPHLHEILEWWLSVDSEGSCEEYVSKLLETKEGLCKLVRGLVETGQIYNLGKSKEIKYIDPSWLEPFTSPGKVQTRLTPRDDEDQSMDDLRKLLNIGIKIRRDGGDPQSMKELKQVRGSGKISL